MCIHPQCVPIHVKYVGVLHEFVCSALGHSLSIVPPHCNSSCSLEWQRPGGAVMSAATRGHPLADTRPSAPALLACADRIVRGSQGCW